MAEVNTEVETIDNKWQKNLLPFMTRTIILMTVFFFLASLLQVIYLNVIISRTPQFDAKESLSSLKLDSASTYEQEINATRLKSLVLLESAEMENQYHQANVLLMSTLWTSYIGFVTGMILAVTGAAFILGKMIGPESEMDSSVAGHRLSFKSASPGLSLCVLGTVLMVATIAIHHDINVKHNAIYISDQQIGDAALPPFPPLPTPPKSGAPQKKVNKLPAFPALPAPHVNTTGQKKADTAKH